MAKDSGSAGLAEAFLDINKDPAVKIVAGFCWSMILKLKPNWKIFQGGQTPLGRNWKPARAGDSDRAPLLCRQTFFVAPIRLSF